LMIKKLLVSSLKNASDTGKFTKTIEKTVDQCIDFYDKLKKQLSKSDSVSARNILTKFKNLKSLEVLSITMDTFNETVPFDFSLNNASNKFDSLMENIHKLAKN
jgi:hypothetical protein